jgi:tellurium resistance protein TerZ
MDVKVENNLEKGQRVNLERADGSKITEFCIGVNWGIIEGGIFRRKKIFIDLDLNCILIDRNNLLYDYVNCREYSRWEHKKLRSNDGAIIHSGNDSGGNQFGNDGLDNETITVNLLKINNNVIQIFFFLNNLEKKDFSKIPYAEIRMYEGSPNEVKEIFASYNVSGKEYSGKKAIIICKLCKKGNEWEFYAIGEPTDDDNLLDTIERIKNLYLGNN